MRKPDRPTGAEVIEAAMAEVSARSKRYPLNADVEHRYTRHDRAGSGCDLCGGYLGERQHVGKPIVGGEVIDDLPPIEDPPEPPAYPSAREAPELVAAQLDSWHRKQAAMMKGLARAQAAQTHSGGCVCDLCVRLANRRARFNPTDVRPPIRDEDGKVVRVNDEPIASYDVPSPESMVSRADDEAAQARRAAALEAASRIEAARIDKGLRSSTNDLITRATAIAKWLETGEAS